MADIKYSPLLDYIMTNSAKSQTTLTAANYILSVLNVFTNRTDFNLSAQDREELRALFAQFFPNTDPNAVREKLSSHITSAGSSLSAGIYMQSKLFVAREYCKKNDRSELSAQVLLQLILRDPDSVVNDCLFSGGSKKATEPFSFSRTVETEAAPTATTQATAAPLPATKQQVRELTRRVKALHAELSDAVFGQETAISVFTSGYFQSELSGMTEKERHRPRATYLFAGPPGVGKTFLAEKAASLLKLPFMRFDMSEYSDKEATLELCGSDAVYKGSKEGNLTGFVSKNPNCVLLFDEIEKAHLNIIHLFLQLLDAGRLRDSSTDNEVDFTGTIVIFTTNAGKQLYEDSDLTNFSGISRKVILNALQKDTNPVTGSPFFPAAICSRFASGNVVMFNHITAGNLLRIAQREVLRHAESFTDSLDIRINIDPQVYTALLFAEGAAADARMMRSRAETFFNAELFELLRLIESERYPSDTLERLSEISVTLDLPRNEPELAKLFAPQETPHALLIASDRVVSQCRTDALVFHTAQNVETIKSLMRKYDIRLALIDPTYLSVSGDFLNIEDIASVGRDLLHYLLEHHSSLPIVLLRPQNSELSREEEVSYLRLGVQGFVSVSGGAAAFDEEMQKLTLELHRQGSMLELAKSNKLVTFETAQSLSSVGDQLHAEIRLFDFSFSVAVDAEDSKSILSNVSKPNVTFDQVIGAEEAKKELRYFVEYLKNPKRYLGTGVSAPKGVLLYGPPGTGKTLLAKATAGESDVTFIAADGNQFLKKYVGEGPEAVHELFRMARKYAPSIIFIDEIDAIAKQRTGEDQAGSAQVLTAFLTEMDGFKNDPARPVFVLAATNFDVDPGTAKSLDPALMRRFDRRMLVDLPDRDDRIRYLRMRMEQNHAFVLSEEGLKNIAMRSTGMSLADLASVVELALRSAIRDGNMQVTDEIFEEAFETFNSGETKHWALDQLERVARHEAGHAFLCWQSGETPSYLTIVARGDHGGYMQHADGEGKAIYTKQELLARLRTSLGGRAAELVYYGEEDGLSSGASGDLRSATAIARSILCSYGMDSEFGISYIDPQSAVSGESSEVVRAAVNKLLSEQMSNAIRLISSNRAAIDALVAELLVKNHLIGTEIDRILSEAR